MRVFDEARETANLERLGFTDAQRATIIAALDAGERAVRACEAALYLLGNDADRAAIGNRPWPDGCATRVPETLRKAIRGVVAPAPPAPASGGEKFTCPKCGASHRRGPMNGVDVYRCPACGCVVRPEIAGYHHSTGEPMQVKSGVGPAEYVAVRPNTFGGQDADQLPPEMAEALKASIAPPAKGSEDDETCICGEGYHPDCKVHDAPEPGCVSPLPSKMRLVKCPRCDATLQPHDKSPPYPARCGCGQCFWIVPTKKESPAAAPNPAAPVAEAKVAEVKVGDWIHTAAERWVSTGHPTFRGQRVRMLCDIIAEEFAKSPEAQRVRDLETALQNVNDQNVEESKAYEAFARYAKQVAVAALSKKATT